VSKKQNTGGGDKKELINTEHTQGMERGVRSHLRGMGLRNRRGGSSRMFFVNLPMDRRLKRPDPGGGEGETIMSSTRDPPAGGGENRTPRGGGFNHEMEGKPVQRSSWLKKGG